MIPLPSRHLVVVVVVILLCFFGFLYANSQYDKLMGERDNVAERAWHDAKQNWDAVHKKTVTVLASVAHADTMIAHERARGDSALRVANALRQVRDSIRMPVYTDSANVAWRDLYFNTLAEANSLRTVVKSDTVALIGAMSDRDKLRAQLLTVDTTGTRAVNTGQKLIDVRTCKILWLVDCPNRRVVAVVSMVLGVAGGAYAEHQLSSK